MEPVPEQRGFEISDSVLSSKEHKDSSYCDGFKNHKIKSQDTNNQKIDTPDNS